MSTAGVRDIIEPGRERESCLYTMIEGEREEEEERWDCRDSLFDGRNAKEEEKEEEEGRARGTKALYCCIMIRLGGSGGER